MIADETRNKVKTILTDVLSECNSKRINNIERSIYNMAIRNKWNTKEYTRKSRSVIYNLRKFENFKNIYTQPFVDYNKEVSKLPWEICPELWESARNAYYLKYIKSFKDDIPDGFYACRKCKSTKTKHTEVQIRSADEPMTCFVVCMDCGNVYKF